MDHQQKLVIEAASTSRILVCAGPGSGKTLVSALRLVKLVSGGIEPSQILVLSFSRSAVLNLSYRLHSLELPPSIHEDLRYLSFRTFDAWTFRMLRLSGAETAELLKAKHDDNICRLTEMLRDDNCADFHSRLKGIRHVIVDEFQDLPGVRAEMVLALLDRLDRLHCGSAGFTVLGDPAQAIYGFTSGPNSGAPCDPWVALKQRFANSLLEVELTKNYRSISELADQFTVLRQVLRDSEKTPFEKLHTVRSYLDELPFHEATGKIDAAWFTELSNGSVAILLRTNGEALRVATMLYGKDIEPRVAVQLRLAGSRDSHVPVWVGVLLGTVTFDRMTRTVFEAVYRKVKARVAGGAVTEDILPDLDTAWHCLQSVVGGDLEDMSLDVRELRDRISWPDVFAAEAMNGSCQSIYVTTIHQSKGLEFDHVALLNRALEPSERADQSEEANIGFVAATRAGFSLQRLAEDVIWQPYSSFEMPDGRRRLRSWLNGWVNMEVGLQGDVDPLSFVSEAVLGSTEAIAALQIMLGSNAHSLVGRKVRLDKVILDECKVFYNICLLNTDGTELLIGRTGKQLTFDLLRLLARRASLPKHIFNVRVAEVRTYGNPATLTEEVAQPWRTSRMWLGVSLCCTADFKPFVAKRK